MTRDKLLILLFVTLVIGFGAGFALRPVIMPPSPTTIANSPSPPVAEPAVSRGTQYFEANIDEARQVVTACREGTIGGDECTNAETAIVTVESAERFKRFRGER